MTIWYGGEIPDPDKLQGVAGDDLAGRLGIRLSAFGEDYLSGTMPVDERTRQPYGLLHGGASVALAETLGSIGGALTLDRRRHGVVGLDINANHVRGVRDGLVTGTARPLHRGRSTQVWGIDIADADGRLVCVSRLTLAVVDRERIDS
ncbi:MAG: hotdog fold thioesterase [Pseudomonadota bacterium]